MSDSDNISETLNSIYVDATNLLKEGAEPLEIAACLIKVGLTFYKTALSPEEYDMIVDTISETRHMITDGHKDESPESRVFH